MPSPTRVSGGRAPKLDFPVTAEIIAASIPQDSSHCMIADSLKAAIPHARAVAVDLAAIRYTDSRNGRRYIYLTPAPAQVALLEFDQGRTPEPFRVKGHAAQIIEPREKAVTVDNGPSPETTSEELTAEPVKQPKSDRATLISNPAGGGTLPIKLGGSPPPLGPLARGVGTSKTGPKYRVGRRREFGLRVMGH